MYAPHTQSKKDLQIVVKELFEKSKVFKYLPRRRHDSFKPLKGSMLDRVSKDDFKQWISMPNETASFSDNCNVILLHWLDQCALGKISVISMESTVILLKCTNLKTPHSQLLLQTLQHWRRWENLVRVFKICIYNLLLQKFCSFLQQSTWTYFLAFCWSAGCQKRITPSCPACPTSWTYMYMSVFWTIPVNNFTHTLTV